LRGGEGSPPTGIKITNHGERGGKFGLSLPLFSLPVRFITPL
jgi:hypothetical protein